MSHISVPAEIVIQCCNNFNAHNAKRDCWWEAEYIREYAEKKRFIIFGKKWGYQKAFEYLENNEDCDTFAYRAIRWRGHNEVVVENLLILAKNGDPVIISDKHAFILKFKQI